MELTHNQLKILVIEDEQAIRRGLCDVLVYHGYLVRSESDGQEGLNQVFSTKYHLVILDIMLPSLDGISICRAIRERDKILPIIMLTAKADEEDIINALSLGADDYVTKPFSVRELTLRIEALLKRTWRYEASHSVLAINTNLNVDLATLSAQGPDQNKIEFTKREVEILLFLKHNKHRAVSRSELLTEIWGYDRAHNIETRTVDIHIAKLRRKIEKDPKNPELLTTVRGQGYQLVC